MAMTTLDADWDRGPSDPALTPMFGRVRLRTLILLRWLAVAGQTLTVLFVHYAMEFPLPIGPCLGVIAASAWINAWLTLALPTQRFAKDWEAFAQLAYDVVQLIVLLTLTGGLVNPFSIMLVAPVVIAVAALPLVWWLALATLALAGSAAMAFWRLPLPWEGAPPSLPPTYLIAMWVALVIAIAFTAVYAWRVGREAKRMGAALAATQTVLAREQRLSALGALSAAAAHELGTPLATIQLTAKEMARFADDPVTKEDAELLVSQAERCRDILRRLSSTQEASDQRHDRLGLAEAIDEAAAPLKGLGAEIEARLAPPQDEAQPPVMRRRAELVYAIGNFIENAVDFAKSRVVVTAAWDARTLAFTVEDDGPGFAPDVLAKLGEPYISTRRAQTGEAQGSGAGGLGLGVFIAITLTERLGGSVSFENAGSRGGAVVRLSLPREPLEAAPLYAATGKPSDSA